MMTILRYSVYALLLLSAVTLMVSFYLGRFVFPHQGLDAISCLNNRDNVIRMQSEPPQNPFSFLVIGDIQSGYGILSKRVLPLARNGCAFAVQTGDLSSHADPGHYALILNEIKKSDVQLPLFVIPGNHDRKEDPDLFERYFKLKQFSFVWSNCLFIFIDNSLGKSLDQQFQFLEQVLEENHQTAHWTFIFMHRPPVKWDHGIPTPDLKRYARFFALKKRYRIDYVISGHIHDYHHAKLDGTTYISNGLETDDEERLANEIYITRVQVTPDKVVIDKQVIPTYFSERFYIYFIDFLVAHLYYPLLGRFF